MAVNIPGLIAMVVFYIFVLGIGIWASVKAKKMRRNTLSRQVEILFLANRSIGLIMGIFTMTATWVGGAFIVGIAESVYDPTRGLIWALIPLQVSLSFIIGGLFFTKPMRENNYISILDPVQRRYGKALTAVLAVVQITSEVLCTPGFLIALGATMRAVLDLPFSVCVWISAAVAISYTVLGGLYSVAYTDVIQMSLILISLWLCVPFVLTSGVYTNIIETAINNTYQAPWLGRLESSDVGRWIDNFLVMSVLGYASTIYSVITFGMHKRHAGIHKCFFKLIPGMHYFLESIGNVAIQDFHQRTMSSTSTSTARLICFIAAGLVIIAGIPSVLIGAVAASTDWNSTSYGSPPPYERGEGAMVLPITLLQFTPSYISIFVIAAVAAAVMSSADSLLLSATTIFTANIYQAIRSQASDKELKWVIRVSIIVAGLVGTSLTNLRTGVLVFWMLSSDLTYTISLPQLLCVLFTDVSNGYGATTGFLVAVVLRVLCGEPLIGLPVFLQFPQCILKDGVYIQTWPFKTICMLITLFSILLFSYVSLFLFQRGILTERWDVFKVKTQRVSPADGPRENNDDKTVSEPMLETKH